MNLPESSEISGNQIKTAKNDVSWLKQLFAKNPFYICSAALLLWGIYRLSIDPKMFATEIGQLFFNFGSIEVYELLLVGTAILLARKKVWYDSTLLVCLENLFVFIPFILISQALLNDGQIAAKLCAIACVLSVARLGLLKKFFAGINLPPRLLLFGGVLLLVNVGVPLLVRSLHKDLNMLGWEKTGAEFYSAAWLIAMPLLLALANVMKRPQASGALLVRKGYFPLLAFLVWTLATGVHFYCVGYVYGLVWKVSLLAPVLWVAAWTLWNRLNDFDFADEESSLEMRNAFLVPSLLVTFLAAINREWTVFFSLTVLNAVAYGILVLRQKNVCAFHLLLLSIALAFAGLPTALAKIFDISRAEAIGGSIAGYFLLRALLSADPRLGVLGGLAAAISSAVFFHDHNYFLNIGAQAGLVFLLIHSLRWDDVEHRDASKARIVSAVMWVLHSVIWVANDHSMAVWTVSSFAAVTVIVFAAVKVIFGFWSSRVVPIAAAAVLAGELAIGFYALVKDASTGLLAVVGSFVLFGLGTLAALTKHRWHKTERIAPIHTQINTSL